MLAFNHWFPNNSDDQRNDLLIDLSQQPLFQTRAFKTVFDRQFSPLVPCAFFHDRFPPNQCPNPNLRQQANTGHSTSGQRDRSSDLEIILCKANLSFATLSTACVGHVRAFFRETARPPRSRPRRHRREDRAPRAASPSPRRIAASAAAR